MTPSQFFVSAWDWKPSVVIGCLALLAAYFWTAGWNRRAIAWIAGVGVVFLALVSPLDELADRYLFTVHMAKHIAFVLVVPALLLMGLPGRSLKWRLVIHPAVAWAAGVGAMCFWHIPILFNTALGNEPLHIIEHLSLLIAGTIYWWPILAPFEESRLQPVPQAVAYLFTSCLACSALGVLITFAPNLLYPEYAHPVDVYGILPLIRNRWGISAAMDQQIGGLLMWVPGCFVYLTAIMAMFARWYTAENSIDAEVEWT